MKKNLDDYIKIYRNVIAADTCVDITNSLNNVEWHQHEFYREDTNDFVSHDKDLSIYNGPIPQKEFIMQTIWTGIYSYISELQFEWFPRWSGYSSVRFNRYNKDTQMNEHCDHIKDLFIGEVRGIPILSVLGALNNDYKGGELVFFQDQIVELKQGDLMVFPSVFMYPHRVETVTEGTRYSFVSWAW